MDISLKKDEILGVEALRGFAALIIAQFHMYFFMSPNGYAFRNKLSLGYTYGWFMVEFFFLLSGFLLNYTYSGNIKEKFGNVYSFIYSRMERIYPTFFVTLLVSAILILVCNKLDLAVINSANNAVTFILNVFCIQYIGVTSPVYSFNIPAWFISDLLLVYIVFYFVCVKNKSMGKKIVMYFLMICLGLFMFRIYFIAPNIYFPIINLDMGRALISFFMGAITCELFKFVNQNKYKKIIVVIIYITMSTICYFALKRFNDRSFETILGDARIFCSLILFPLFLIAVLNSKYIVMFLENKILKYLGKISYSIFLWHYPIILLIRIINSLTSINIDYSSRLFFAFYFILIIILSSLSYYFIEIPGRKLVHNYKANFFLWFNRLNG